MPTSSTATATPPLTSTSTAASRSATAPNKQTTATNTNTDALCCDDNAGFLTRALYRYNLWTGLYMLEQDERLFFHIFGWIFLSSLFLYMGVFLHGFVDGVRADISM